MKKCSFCGKKFFSDKECPFKCVFCGSINFNVKALHDYIIVYPIKKPVVAPKYIELPDIVEPEYTDFGIILSVGPGYYDNKKFHPIDPKLKPGAKVVYDKTVLWEVTYRMPDGSEEILKIMPHRDVKTIVMDKNAQ